MIPLADFQRAVELLGQEGADDIAWAEAITLPPNAEEFAWETVFVICNSGMKNTVARRIFEKCRARVAGGGSAHDVFGHKGKSTAIDTIWRDRARLFAEFIASPDRVSYLGTLPWIGNITKYHLAKNFGVDVAKPDVHLQRLSDLHGVTAQALCESLAAQTGYRVATVDTILWRACANGILNSRTGQFSHDPRSDDHV